MTLSVQLTEVEEFGQWSVVIGHKDVT